MNTDRAIALVFAVSFAAVLLLGMYLLRGSAPNGSAALTPTARPSTPTAAASPTATAGAPQAARGYRLAGTVVGDLAYAIIEDPAGANQLYRPGQVVPNLGRVVAVEADHIVLDGADGTYALQLAPAPTTSPTAPPRTVAPRSLTPERTPRAPSESESLP
jgi:hypothetical protein